MGSVRAAAYQASRVRREEEAARYATTYISYMCRPSARTQNTAKNDSAPQ